ncbi:hypothetical protein CAPTEDRAFT_194145 [Capitella teleta]|uniref:Tyrosine-protein phosphatase domain-containing protein n=1 Tax=Capitella teleta TaxID=283909 RepID=R7TDN0_CAPTE|nr:hypothetical protein CAPTEDRAFT_194145 [Capitella teleta]|eukprot:ELT91833.1 hypothetical protein CAPTEDRAFT_194145 [Capitella teleta]
MNVFPWFLGFAMLHGLHSLRHGGFEDRYKGCYIDNNKTRALTHRAYKDLAANGVNSNGRCIRECANRGFTFAGTSASNECHCGNNYDYDKHDPHANTCTQMCHNNPSETCGADWRLQIYSDCSVGKGGCQHDCNEQYIDVWCSCRDGYKVSTGDWKKCVEVNECNGVKGKDYHEDCHTCLNTIGSYTCNCKGGYKVDPSTKQKCIDINECEGKRGVDYHQDCHNCTNAIGSYTCGCRGGYELDPETKKKCIDVNECKGVKGKDYHEDCHKCLNTIGSYTCNCKGGYKVDPSTNQKCIDINECEGTRGVDFHQDCHNCTNAIGSYTCGCRGGYELDPETKKMCIDVDECKGERGVDYNQDCHHCINAVPGYTCECNEGYQEDSRAVEGNCIDINECLGDKGVDYHIDCHNCSNTKGSYTCDCAEGYELHPNGTFCIDTDECQRGLYDVDCHTCVNLIGGHTCMCYGKYVLDANKNNETCFDPTVQSATSISIGMIIGIVVPLLLLIAAAIAVVFLIRRRRSVEKKAYTSAKVPDANEVETNDYEKLRDISIDFPPSTAAMKQTPDATYYNTPENHVTGLVKNSIGDAGSSVSKSEKSKHTIYTNGTLSRITNQSQRNSKLKFTQVEGFKGRGSFLAIRCPMGDEAVGEFWRLVKAKQIHTVVLLEDVSSKVLPVSCPNMNFDDMNVFCKDEWQNRGIKKFTVTISKKDDDKEYVNLAPSKTISVLAVRNKLTNKVIINLRKHLVQKGHQLKCGIMCKDGQQLSGFFIGVHVILDMVDEGNKIDILHGMQHFKAVCPDFAPSEEQLLQLSHLAKDYISYAEKYNKKK